MQSVVISDLKINKFQPAKIILQQIYYYDISFCFRWSIINTSLFKLKFTCLINPYTRTNYKSTTDSIWVYAILYYWPVIKFDNYVLIQSYAKQQF